MEALRTYPADGRSTLEFYLQGFAPERLQRLSSAVSDVQVIIYSAYRLVDLIEPNLDGVAARNWRAGREDVVCRGMELSRLLFRVPNGGIESLLLGYLAGEEVQAMQDFVVRAEAYLTRRGRAEAARDPAYEARTALAALRNQIVLLAASPQ